MRISTLLKFLVGERAAIHTIANTPHAVWIALLFVLTGGLARNYDKEPLLHEPVHVLGPLIVSTLIGLGLFLVLYLATGRPGATRPGFRRVLLVFMTLYWMTAPMAWLYGIPTERLTDIVTATEINLWTLAIVSVWRVLLIARVASVLFGVPMLAAAIVVLAYSNVIATGALIATPFPVINVMGGIELSQSEQLISGISTAIAFLSFITIPVLLLASLTALLYLRGSWQVPETAVEQRPHVQPSMTIFATASLAFWLALLPLTQPAQALRHETEAALKGGRVKEGILRMAERGPLAYPPHWDPPPRRLYGEREPDPLDVFDILIAEQLTDGWVAERYAAKLTRGRLRTWLTEDKVVRFAAAIQHIDSGPQYLWENRRWLLDHPPDVESFKARTAQRSLRELAQKYAEDNDLDWDEDRY